MTRLLCFQILAGRNVLPGQWTFQIIEAFEETYYIPVRKAEEKIRNQLVQGKRHLLEADLKRQRHTTGREGHERQP